MLFVSIYFYKNTGKEIMIAIKPDIYLKAINLPPNFSMCTH